MQPRAHVCWGVRACTWNTTGRRQGDATAIAMPSEAHGNPYHPVPSEAHGKPYHPAAIIYPQAQDCCSSSEALLSSTVPGATEPLRGTRVATIAVRTTHCTLPPLVSTVKGTSNDQKWRSTVNRQTQDGFAAKASLLLDLD